MYHKLKRKQLNLYQVKYTFRMLLILIKTYKKKNYILGESLYTLTNFDKRILVWVKRFPSMDKVPKQVR